jgi:hypothetical protein
MKPITTQNEIKGKACCNSEIHIHTTNRGVRTPDVTDAEALIPDAKTQSKDKADFSSSELKDVERGRLQKVAAADIVGGGKLRRCHVDGCWPST